MLLDNDYEAPFFLLAIAIRNPHLSNYHYSDASVKDMEAAAVAWAAELYAVPYFALKVVTDIGRYTFS